MKGRYISMFVISVALVYSAPTKNSTTLLNPTSTSNLTKGVKLGKPVLRSEIDNTPGKCCSDISKRCCPYDYDDECGNSENRTLCGYNKNQKKPEVAETTTIKYGLICWPKDDRLDCGYDRRFDDSEVISTVHNEEITTKTTLSSSTETTLEAATTSMTIEETKTITSSTITAATEETDTATFSTVTTATQPITEWTTATELPSSTVTTTETTAFSTEGTTTTREITKANVEFTSKSEINILPWKCCSSNILKIGGPYDYDENKCYIYGNRTLCGYNKNPSTAISIETKSQFIKNGQNCEINGERYECGYGEGSAATDVMSTIPVVIQDTTVPITEATTVTTTESTETITVTTETTETTTDTTTTETTTELSETNVMLLRGSLKPKLKTTRKKYRKLTTIECVKLHSKIACRAIPINEELDYA